MTGRSCAALLLGLWLGVTACSTDSDSSSITTAASQASTATSTAQTTSTEASSTSEHVDVDALLVQYGFERCGHREPNDQLTDERREELFRATAAAGLGHGATFEPGSRVLLQLYVLNEEALKTLATLVDPSEVCVDGADPEGYVADGRQPLGGLGWRWLGAQSIEVGDSPSLITSQAGYDAMWGTFQAGPEPLLGPIGAQPEVDFSHEVVLTIQTKGWGINGGICGIRLDAVNVTDGRIIIDWFRPGGDAECPSIYDEGTYAIVLDLDIVGQLPVRVSLRGRPDATPAVTESLTLTDNVLLWPLARLQYESFGHQEGVLHSTELANSIECRLFRGVRETKIVARTDMPPEFLIAAERYVLSTEVLLAELGSDAEPPRAVSGQPLHSLIGRPDQGMTCG